MEITRRNLVEGAAIAGAGLAAAAAIGSTTSQALADATMEETRGAYPWGDTAPAIADDDIEDTIEAEVIIVGVGLAGASALISAAETGAESIIYFDKTETGYSETGFQTTVIDGVESNWGRAGIYDIAEICNHEINEGCGWPKHAIWFRWGHGIGDAFDWVLSHLDNVEILDSDDIDFGYEGNYVAPLAYPLPEGWDPTKEYNTTYATSVTWSSGNYVPAVVEQAGELTNVTGYPAHRVEQLIMEDGRCAGVYAYNYSTGKYKKALASKGVILSCGDYAGNDELVKYFCPVVYENGIQLMYSTFDPEGNVANTGEHMKMATWAGARISQYQAPIIHHMGNTLNGGMGVMGIAPFLRLNKDGKRFMNKDTPGQQTENQIELLKDFCCFMFFDGAWPDEVDHFAPTHGSVFHFLQEGESGEGCSLADVENAVANGSVLEADTIDELLDMVNDEYGIDVENAKAAIERYNDLAHEGYDWDFGKLASRLFALENPPYYCVTMGRTTILAIASGLESDEECHTFDQDRNVIPGLYVCGNTQGDRFAIQYPIAMEGVATSMCLFYGKVAGENCVNGI